MICLRIVLSQDWTTISAISNIVMAIVAFGALGYSIKQNYDLKKQREEDERGRVLFSIIIANKIYLLKVENIGKRSVYNLRFSLNEDFVNNIEIPQFREYLLNTMSKKIHISPNSSKLYGISPIEGVGGDDAAVKILKRQQIKIRGEYNGAYRISESFTMDGFTGSIIINDPIIQELSKINESIRKIK